MLKGIFECAIHGESAGNALHAQLLQDSTIRIEALEVSFSYSSLR
jgi:hypothetical protein